MMSVMMTIDLDRPDTDMSPIMVLLIGQTFIPVWDYLVSVRWAFLQVLLLPVMPVCLVTGIFVLFPSG